MPRTVHVIPVPVPIMPGLWHVRLAALRPAPGAGRSFRQGFSWCPKCGGSSRPCPCIARARRPIVSHPLHVVAASCQMISLFGQMISKLCQMIPCFPQLMSVILSARSISVAPLRCIPAPDAARATDDQVPQQDSAVRMSNRPAVLQTGSPRRSREASEPAADAVKP